MSQSPRLVAAGVAFAGLSVAFCAVSNQTTRWWIGLVAGVAAVLAIRSFKWEAQDGAGLWAVTLFPGVTMILASIGMLCKPYPESSGVVILAGVGVVACFVASMFLHTLWFLRRRQRVRSGKAA